MSLSLDPVSPDHVAALFSAYGDTIFVDVDIGNVLHDEDCGAYGIFVLGSGTFPRSTIGDETISVEITFNSGNVYGNGTLTLTRAG